MSAPGSFAKASSTSGRKCCTMAVGRNTRHALNACPLEMTTDAARMAACVRMCGSAYVLTSKSTVIGKNALGRKGAGGAMPKRKTIGGTSNPSVVGAAKTRNNGRYNGNGREWETPPEIFSPLNAEFGFTLDPCATPANAKCPRFYTEDQDGLSREWHGERVFMNPPYGKEIYPWTRKAKLESERGTLVVGLLPASTDLKWWHEDVIGCAEVRYIRGRVRFLTDGPYRASGFFPSVVVVWRPKVAPFPPEESNG